MVFVSVCLLLGLQDDGVVVCLDGFEFRLGLLDLEVFRCVVRLDVAELRPNGHVERLLLDEFFPGLAELACQVGCLFLGFLFGSEQRPLEGCLDARDACALSLGEDSLDFGGEPQQGGSLEVLASFLRADESDARDGFLLQRHLQACEEVALVVGLVRLSQPMEEGQARLDELASAVDDFPFELDLLEESRELFHGFETAVFFGGDHFREQVGCRGDERQAFLASRVPGFDGVEASEESQPPVFFERETEAGECDVLGEGVDGLELSEVFLVDGRRAGGSFEVLDGAVLVWLEESLLLSSFIACLSFILCISFSTSSFSLI